MLSYPELSLCWKLKIMKHHSSWVLMAMDVAKFDVEVEESNERERKKYNMDGPW